MSNRSDVLKLAGDELRCCIQCGSCSASCSTADLMDKSIRELVRLVLNDRCEEALDSRSIWLCTSCLLCTVRCPRGIRPKSLVAALRHIHEAEGRRNADSSLEDLFMGQVKDTGRVSEFYLSALYALHNPKATVQIMTMGLELIPKGKIDGEKSRILGIEELSRIFEGLEES
ncbi:MAG: 4Fe-4S dicluster domain-containing protein [Methanotrichaceae archaeon]|nr:4Fe-4S dicluster domain-containing protein [Methanotrichaceae archaeon]